MSFDTAILIFTCFINLSLGLFILLRNPKIISSIAFFGLTTSISAWAVANYLTEQVSVPLNLNILCNRLAYLFGWWCLVAIAAFCYTFPARARVSRRRVASFSLAAAGVSVLAVTNLVAGQVSKDHAGLHFTVGALAIPYAALIFLLLIFSARQILRNKKGGTAEVKSQLNLILFGFGASASLALFTNLILPSIVESFSTAKFGPLLTVIFVIATTYAIIRHRLFDIRLVVARSLAYALSLATIAGLFVLGTFAASSVFLNDTDSKASSVKWTYTILAVMLAFIFAPLKRFFDKYTSRIFYRDAYDSQTFLDEFNKLIVGTYELNPLLKKSAAIIAANLKPTYCAFGIRETNGRPQRVIGTPDSSSFSAEDIAYVRQLTPTIGHKIIVADELGQSYQQLQTVLQRNNIAIMARLASKTKEEGIGYLLLGPKKSGNPFSAQDINVVEIISNELVIAIQNSIRFEEIENFANTLQQKVSDATRKLRHSNEKLRELDEAKDDFVSMASHQLRTPLTSVKGYISMVLEGDAGPINETQKQLLEQSFASSQRMVYLIADLLNVSRLKTGKFMIETKPTDLSAIIDEEVKQLQETAASRQLSLTFDKPEKFPILQLDETKTRQVVMNFIDNAIYYTPSGGHIKVELLETPASVELRIIDDGIGVPKSEVHHLFTKFYRAGNARKARPDGTGLGLFMAKKVIVAQGGAIIFDTAEGKGSTFGFVFSKTKLAVPAVTVATPVAVAKAKTPTPVG